MLPYFMKRKTESVELTEVEVKWLGISAKWIADRAQQTAAWEMYVELITRISLQPLPADEGLLREALSSLYSLFGETRRILKAHGPSVARKLSNDSVTFAHVSVAVLNEILRPLLTRWHPALEQYESARAAGVSANEHEQPWPRSVELRDDLERTRVSMNVYADLLAAAAGLDSLHEPRGKA